MSYNQKVWLGVLTICALFWLTLISGIYTYGKTNTPKHEQNQQEQAGAGNLQSPSLNEVATNTPPPPIMRS